MKKVNIVIDKVENNERIWFEDAIILLQDATLMELADLANKKRWHFHLKPDVTFVVDRNINYTNICVSECRFCAFFRKKNSNDGYVISYDELYKKIEETLKLGGTQILLQGGMHPDFDIGYYIELLKFIKKSFTIHIHGFSPPEILHISNKASLSIKEVLERFINAGLDSIPGGGAEILVDEIRQQISPNKCNSESWLQVMKVAHNLGLKSSATMMFGHIEKEKHIVEHLLKIRNLQDETKGFTAFIPWTFQPKNTDINISKKDSIAYLRVLALSRIVLDNIFNIQASWVTQGAKIAQSALFFGANDMGSTMIEENVVSAAGVDYMLPMQELIYLIKSAGFKAKQRDCFYNVLKDYE